MAIHIIYVCFKLTISYYVYGICRCGGKWPGYIPLLGYFAALFSLTCQDKFCLFLCPLTFQGQFGQTFYLSIVSWNIQILLERTFKDSLQLFWTWEKIDVERWLNNRRLISSRLNKWRLNKWRMIKISSNALRLNKWGLNKKRLNKKTSNKI